MKLRFRKNLDKNLRSMLGPFEAGILKHASKLSDNDIWCILSQTETEIEDGQKEGKYWKSFTLAKQLRL